jgi:hypothetical protein
MSGDEQVRDIYCEKYVAFVDLLGFKSIVVGAERFPEKRQGVLEILRLMQSSLCDNPYIGMRLTQFSDCTIISADRTPQGLFEMLASLDALTSNLLQYDVLVRGGFAVGGVHHDATFVYGVGVNEAHALEQCAVHPRILVTETVRADVLAGNLANQQWLVQDEDGRWFVHYLRQYALYNPSALLPGTVVLRGTGTSNDRLCLSSPQYALWGHFGEGAVAPALLEQGGWSTRGIWPYRGGRQGARRDRRAIDYGAASLHRIGPRGLRG